MSKHKVHLYFIHSLHTCLKVSLYNRFLVSASVSANTCPLKPEASAHSSILELGKFWILFQNRYAKPVSF